MFEPPTFTIWELFFAALGALSLWVKLAHEKRKAYAWSALLEQFVPNEKIRVIVEIFVFVSVGAIVSSAVVRPINPAQAIAAGIGWTGFLSAPHSGRKPSQEKAQQRQAP